MDLFREWDTDGDGNVSRKEFVAAMPKMGLDVDKKEILELFDSWDADGGGTLDFKELQKILRTSPNKGGIGKTK
jgi:Ca2+-binding EF-hand superfamily protein